MARRWVLVSAGVLVAMTACAGESDVGDGTTTISVLEVASSDVDRSTTTVSAEPPETTQPTTAGALIDWSARPVVFFSPLPPLPEGSDLPFGHGSDDFYELFEPGASWSTAADRVSVFLLNSTYVRHYSTDEQLRTVIDGLDRLGIAVGLEVGPLPAPPEGQCIGAEGFGGVYELDMVQRIEQLGGTVAVVAFDEPYAFGHRSDGPDDCRRPIEQVAAEVATFVSQLRSIDPDVVVGDIEPMWASPRIGADEMAAWLDAYEAAAGEPFAFLHLDSEWSRPDWAQVLVDVSAVARARGVPVGVIYFGGDVDSDDEWMRLSARRMFEYEQVWGGTLDHVAFESWNDHPYHALPETDMAAMTSLVNRYFGRRASVTVESAAAEPGHALVRASVLDESGVGIIGVPVSVEATPLDGAPQPWTIEGVVPEGTLAALVQISVNDAVALPASTDVVLNEVAYTEGSGDSNHVGNGSFAGLDGWGPYGEGSAVAVPGRGLRVTASAEQAAFVDSARFSIQPGASYRLSFTAEVPATSAGTTRVSLIFFGDADVESGRVAEILRPAPTLLGESVTDASGTATVTAQGLTAGRYRIRASQPGELDLWPAYADTEVTIS